MAKVATGRIGPRAINQLKNTLLLIPKVTEITSQSDQEALRSLGEGLILVLLVVNGLQPTV